MKAFIFKNFVLYIKLVNFHYNDKADSDHTHTFASLTSKPTTLSGYGITDAASSSHTHIIKAGVIQLETTQTASSSETVMQFTSDNIIYNTIEMKVGTSYNILAKNGYYLANLVGTINGSASDSMYYKIEYWNSSTKAWQDGPGSNRIGLGTTAHDCSFNITWWMYINSSITSFRVKAYSNTGAAIAKYCRIELYAFNI